MLAHLCNTVSVCDCYCLSWCTCVLTVHVNIFVIWYEEKDQFKGHIAQHLISIMIVVNITIIDIVFIQHEKLNLIFFGSCIDYHIFSLQACKKLCSFFSVYTHTYTHIET